MQGDAVHDGEEHAGDDEKNVVGFAEVSENKVSILVDSAEKAGDIDIQRAEKALERAKSRLEKIKGTEDVDFTRAELALKRAISRIKVAQKSA